MQEQKMIEANNIDMIKILHIVPRLDSGGVERLLLNYYTYMDKTKFRFDFIVHGNEEGMIEKDFKQIGSKVFHIKPKRGNFLDNLISMYKIIKENNYDVIHVHQGFISVFPIYFAKKANIKVRIAHSHLAFKKENAFVTILNKIFKFYLKRYATHWFACGLDAAKYLWGDKALREGKVFIMKNAIELDKFRFNPYIRGKVRKNLNIEGKFVVGNVGRFSYQKNHEFLIKIFYEINKKDKNAVLLLVGNGELEQDIRKQVMEMGLEDSVIFLGARNDVNELMQAMDVFVLPSRFEGLPVVCIEAQAASLACFVSESITEEVKITDLIHFISLTKTPAYWSDEILRCKKTYERKDIVHNLTESGYQITYEFRKLENSYNIKTWVST